MKNLWLSMLAIAAFSASIIAGGFEQTVHNTGYYIGQGLRTATKAVNAVQNANSAEMTVYAMPFSIAHGLHGYAQRFTKNNRKHQTPFLSLHDPEDLAAKSTMQKLKIFCDQPNPNFTSYPHFWNRLQAEGLKNFNFWHPIQSLKGNTSKRMPPVVGSMVVTPTIVGYLHHVLTSNFSE